MAFSKWLIPLKLGLLYWTVEFKKLLIMFQVSAPTKKTRVHS